MLKNLKLQFQFIAVMLTVLIVQTSLPLAVHAEGNPWGVIGGDVDDNGTGGGSGGGSYFDELGIQQENSGYRIYLNSVYTRLG